MNLHSQDKWSNINLADNPEARIPVCLLLDISSSMQGEPIRKLNEAIHLFSDEIKRNELVATKVEITVITFGGTVQIETSFISADDYQPSNLHTKGLTPMGGAGELMLNVIESRRKLYKQHELSSYCPMGLMLTDGEPTDAYKEVAQKIKTMTANQKLLFYGIGIGDANMSVLSEFSDTQNPIKLETVDSFATLFQLFSDSLNSVANSVPSEQFVPLLNAATINP